MRIYVYMFVYTRVYITYTRMLEYTHKDNTYIYLSISACKIGSIV